MGQHPSVTANKVRLTAQIKRLKAQLDAATNECPNCGFVHTSQTEEVRKLKFEKDNLIKELEKFHSYAERRMEYFRKMPTIGEVLKGER